MTGNIYFSHLFLRNKLINFMYTVLFFEQLLSASFKNAFPGGKTDGME